MRAEWRRRSGIPPGPGPRRRGNRAGECCAALVPALIVAAVWCLGCYIYLWMRLYRSFAADFGDGGGDQVKFGRRGDVLAARLEHFLVGQGGGRGDVAARRGRGFVGWSRSDARNATTRRNDINHTVLLRNLVDLEMANKIQSALVSRTGYPNLILGAYLEPPLPVEMSDGNSTARMRPRAHAPRDLKYAAYPYRPRASDEETGDRTARPMPGACSENGAQWTFPTLHPRSMDGLFEGNVFKKRNNFDLRWDLAQGGHCPVDADPFLPWIHDAFPSDDGGHVEIVISNRRRCNTDPGRFRSDLRNLEPQVALMQPVPVRRIREDELQSLGNVSGVLWSPDPNSGIEDANLGDESFPEGDAAYDPPRYALATSLNEADEDGKYTRFICRFHAVVFQGDNDGDGTNWLGLRKVVLGETLTTYPYNPEHANWSKRGSKPMLTSLEQGHDEQLWNSVYTVRCPVPRLGGGGDGSGGRALADLISSGKSVVGRAPSLYLDLIPIRTPPRRSLEGFGIPGAASKQPSGGATAFEPGVAWGDARVLPRVEASGRWTNIPVCRPPRMDEGSAGDEARGGAVPGATPRQGSSDGGAYFLVACVWASRSFPTRGQTSNTDSSTSDRLREFLAYHIDVAGFDRVYVYDNSDPEGGDDLSDVTNLFPDRTTRVPWPHRVCNNNRPMHANPGERSSQYAAESSCRARYGPGATWMASLDVDEYIVPTGGRWKSVQHWLEHVTKTEDSTKILSFFQTRALPNVDLMIPYAGKSTVSCRDGSADISNAMCLIKDPRKTFMETYNCEPSTHPKPSWAWRAKKQIYRPDFVLNHFVHYSVVTRQLLNKPLETSPRFVERSPFERRVNELTEGFLLHAKTTGPDATSKWREKCPSKGTDIVKNSSCKVGIPSSSVLLGGKMSPREGGDGAEPSNTFESNCYRHVRVMSKWVPRLEESLRSLGKVV